MSILSQTAALSPNMSPLTAPGAVEYPLTGEFDIMCFFCTIKYVKMTLQLILEEEIDKTQLQLNDNMQCCT